MVRKKLHMALTKETSFRSSILEIASSSLPESTDSLESLNESHNGGLQPNLRSWFYTRRYFQSKQKKGQSNCMT